MNPPVLLHASFILSRALRLPETKRHKAKGSFRKTQLEEQLPDGGRALQGEPLVILRPKPVVGVSFDYDDQIRELMKKILKSRTDPRDFPPLPCRQDVRIRRKVQIRHIRYAFPHPMRGRP